MAQPTNPKKKQHIQNIKVVVRVRPLTIEEREKNVKNIIQFVSAREIQMKEKKYHVDKIFHPGSSQMDVYSYVVGPMIGDVLAGYNCTVFAYGQTGTGKTHTMTGSDSTNISGTVHWKEDELAGCIPRAAAHIFDEIGSMRVNDYNVRVSYLELYNEEVRDLLSSDANPAPLNMFNDSKGSFCIQNLNEITVFSSKDIYMLLEQGNIKRQTAFTLMNNNSSRSHTVFTITVHIREANLTGEEVLKTGKINLVDLAGSENIAKTGVKDKRAQELVNINRSLLTLGRVIQTLADKNNKHVPYRESKLTRILQDSLGGHTKTCIIATVSPAHSSHEVTQSTLDYACRARDIRNTPMVNEKVTKVQMLKEMTHEIDKLKKDLEAARTGNGICVDKENWDELHSQLKNNSNMLNLKNDIIEETKKKLMELETIRDIKEQQYEEAMNVCRHREKIINRAKTLLKEQHRSLKQEQYLSTRYLEAATESKTTAKLLLETTENLSKNQEILHRKLENQYLSNFNNEKIIKEQGTLLSHNLNRAISELKQLTCDTDVNINNVQATLGAAEKFCNEYSVQSKMCWSNDIQSTIQANLEKRTERIQANSLKTYQNVLKTDGLVNEMFDIVKNCTVSSKKEEEKFKQYDQFSNEYTNGILSNIIQGLMDAKASTASYIEELRVSTSIATHHMAQIDKLLSYAENEKEFFCNSRCTGEFAIRKSEVNNENEQVHQNHERLSEILERCKEDLEVEKNECLQTKKHFVKSDQLEVEKLEEVIRQKIDLEEQFLKENMLHLNNLQENMGNIKQSVEINVSEVNTALHQAEEIQRDIATNITSIRREGDTPQRNSVNYPKRLGEGSLSRDILIKKFKEEFNEEKENMSIILNMSTESLDPTNDSGDNSTEIEDSIQ